MCSRFCGYTSEPTSLALEVVHFKRRSAPREGTREGRRWTDEERAQLSKMAESQPFEKVAAALSRGVSGVRCEWRRLNPTTRKPYPGRTG